MTPEMGMPVQYPKPRWCMHEKGGCPTHADSCIYTCLLADPTRSGKTFLKKLVKLKNEKIY